MFLLIIYSMWLADWGSDNARDRVNNRAPALQVQRADGEAGEDGCDQRGQTLIKLAVERQARMTRLVQAVTDHGAARQLNQYHKGEEELALRHCIDWDKNVDGNSQDKKP
ncbi:unnamed protein product [Effrenium voratum]|uniref:Uncharacterized protein n=1 Tax=Effrenium voratum TaxID=2562239 RepID=A0AA36IYI1_9DINO|nr:unnamed protein product [Effrenium voratum]CAJ1440428.1 unnamed protein product [Effrenium voratum]